MGASSRDVPRPKSETASIVVQEPNQYGVAAAFAARYRFAVQLFGPLRVGGLLAQEVGIYALSQQEIVAKYPGSLDRLISEGDAPPEVACEREGDAERSQGLDEQPVVAEPASDLHRLLTELY